MGMKERELEDREREGEREKERQKCEMIFLCKQQSLLIMRALISPQELIKVLSTALEEEDP